MRTVALLLSLFLPLQFCGQLLAYDEPDNFAGLKFGQDLAKQLPECSKSIRTSGKRCYQKGAGSYNLGTYELYNMGDIQKLLVELTAKQSDAGGLSKVFGIFDSAKFVQLTSVLGNQYGRPTTVTQQVDSSGLPTGNTITIWKGRNISIIVEERVPQISRGMMTFMAQ
jgi:hypothetical protein